MSQGYIRDSVPDDCRIIAENMRKADIAEIKAASNWKPIEAMTNGFVYSNPPLTIIRSSDDAPIAMWGVVPEFDAGVNKGRIWLLGTPGIRDIRMTLLRECNHWIRKVTEGYDVVYNNIDKRNTLHIKWLKWLEFSFIKEMPQYGHEKRPFLEFVRII